jgi:pimeloyl-ACP methyl ester carboxylesterase
MVELPQVATRVDRAGRFTEEAAFLNVSGERVFAVTHLPDRSAQLGVVVCCPLLVELLTNYRREVLLARSLAAAGVAVQRFHYRGAGHSSGEEAGSSLETMAEDAMLAVEHLRRRAGTSRIAFVGTRWGALVAARAAQRVPGAALALWEPVVDGGRYFREVIRGRLVREMKDSRFAGATTDAWASELSEKGWVDILGYRLHGSVYESGRNQRLEQMITGQTGPVFVVQLGRQHALRPDYTRLKQHLETQKIACDVGFVHDDPAWLFPGHRMESGDQLVKMTTEWLAAHAAKPPRAS